MKTKLYTSILCILVLFSQCKQIGYFRKSTSSLLDPVNTFGLFLGLDKAGVSSNFISVTGIKTSINEGETQEVGVRLGSKPKSEITVKVTSSDSAVTVNGESIVELKFTPENYRTEQKVKLLAVEEEGAVNETVTIAYSSIGLETVSQTLSIKDDLSLIVTNFPASLYEGEAATVKVKLSKDIYTPKTVVINSNNPIVRIDGINSKTLYFTPQNAKIEQYVTLTGQIDNNSQYEVVNVDFVGANMIDQNLTLTMTDDLAIQIVNLPTSLYEGQSVAVGIKFNRQLFFPTTMNIVSNNPAVTIDGNSFRSLSFDATNGTIEQTVIIKSTIDLNTVNEVVTLSLSATGVSTVNRNLTVIDDLSVDLISMPSSVYEGETKQFGVKLSREIYDNVQVTLTSNSPAAVLNGTASINLNFDATNGTIPQTVNLSGAFDSNQATESVTVNITGTGITASSANVTVADDLELIPTVSVTQLAEGMSNMASVGFNREIFANTTVTVTSNDPAVTVNGGMSATLNFAYTYPATIPPPQFVTLQSTVDNNNINENVSISFSSPNLVTKTHGLSIQDDLFITQQTVPTTMKEGESATVAVNFTRAPTSSKTVTISSDNPAIVLTVQGTFQVGLSTVTMDFTTANTPQNLILTSIVDNNSTNDNVNISFSSTGVQTVIAPVTVLDDAEVLVTSNFTYLTEEADTVLGVKLSKSSDTDKVVTVTMSPSGIGKLNGSPDSTTILIPAASSTIDQALSVYINNDNNIASENVTLTFSCPGMATVTKNFPTFDNDAQNIVLTGSVSELTEGQNTNLSVKLLYEPLQDFTTVYLNSTNTISLGLSQTVLVFTKANYMTPQSVTVTALEDVNESSETVSIMANSSGLPIQLYNFNVIDNDTKVVVSGSSILTEGNLSSLNVYLSGSPGKNRTIRLTSSNPNALKFGIAEGTATNFVDLEFTPYQFNQNVFIIARQDANVVNDSATVTGSSPGIINGSLSILVQDKDIMNLDISSSNIEVDEGTSKSLEIKLTQEPNQDVTVSFASANSTTVTVSPSALTFNSTNWNTPQSIQVNGVQDSNMMTETVGITITSKYADNSTAVSDKTILVKTIDDDVYPIFSGSSSITETGEATITVRMSGDAGKERTVLIECNPSSANSGDCQSRLGINSLVTNNVSLNFNSLDYSIPKTITLYGKEISQDNTLTLSLRASGVGIVDSFRGITYSPKLLITSVMPNRDDTDVSPSNNYISIIFNKDMKTSIIPNVVIQNNLTSIPTTGSSVGWIGTRQLQINLTSWVKMPENTEITWILNRNEVVSSINSLKAASSDLQGSFTTGIRDIMYPVIGIGGTPFSDFQNSSYLGQFAKIDPSVYLYFKEYEWGKATWYDAINVCNEYNKQNSGVGYAGINKWRLPTLRELLTLNNPGSWWTSTTFPGNQGQVLNYSTTAGRWTQDYNPIYTALESKSSQRDVVCVMDTMIYFAPSRTDLNDGTVKMKIGNNSYLYWEKCSRGQIYSAGNCSGSAIKSTYSAGITDYCTQKGSGWRLPSRNEIYSILDTSKSFPVLNSTLFPNSPISVGAAYFTSELGYGSTGNCIQWGGPGMATCLKYETALDSFNIFSILNGGGGHVSISAGGEYYTKCVKGPLP